MSDDDYPWSTRQTLMQKIKNKYDDDSWEEFVYYYKQYIYNIIRNMNINHHDANEILQLVLIKLWKKLPTFEYETRKGKFRNWLHTVTANEVKDYIRKRTKNLAKLNQAEQEKETNYLNTIDLPEIDSIAEKEWKNYLANLAWQRVEDDFEEQVKESFLLLTQGTKVDVIAEKLSISESSVYVYKKRVQDRLRQEIARLNYELN